MSVEVTLGKRQLQAEALLPMLSGHNIWSQLMPAIVIDQALRTLNCTVGETEAYYSEQIAADGDFIEKKKAQMVREGTREDDLDFFISRPVLLAQFKEKMFAPQVGSTFLKLKAGLDKVVFLMLRNKDHELLRELYFRIESSEEMFEPLAARYAEGSEATGGGRIGPIEIRQLNPSLARVLSTAKVGVVNPPAFIEGVGVITRLQEHISAKLDDAMKQKLIDQLFNEWVNNEVQSFFY
ncbi:MAG: peptidylprolyl isomerase [Chlorobiaceae bacterium]